MYKRRWQILADIISENNFKLIVEVGVFEGQTCMYILQNINSVTHYYAVDLIVHENVLNMSFIDSRLNIVNLSSLDASKQFNDNSIDLIFIDANHEFVHVYEDIISWLPKLRDGGIICGHDLHELHPSVIKAVNMIFGEIGYYVIAEKDQNNRNIIGVWIAKKEKKNE